MRYDRGFAKVYRLDHKHWLRKDNNARLLWYDLILMANYKATKIMSGRTLVEIPPGTIVTSRRELSVQSNFSENTIRRVLQMLKNAQLIHQQNNQQGTIITICNWCRISDDDDLNNQQNNQQQDQQQDQQPTHDRTSNRTTYKEVKKERTKEGKNKNTVVPDDDSTVLADIWNNNTADIFPKVAKLNDKRRSAMRKAFKEHSVIADWEKFAISLEKSKFHRGENDRGWVADFDWFIRPGNIIKFIEGSR